MQLPSAHPQGRRARYSRCSLRSSIGMGAASRESFRQSDPRGAILKRSTSLRRVACPRPAGSRGVPAVAAASSGLTAATASQAESATVSPEVTDSGAESCPRARGASGPPRAERLGRVAGGAAQRPAGERSPRHAARPPRRRAHHAPSTSRPGPVTQGCWSDDYPGTSVTALTRPPRALAHTMLPLGCTAKSSPKNSYSASSCRSG